MPARQKCCFRKHWLDKNRDTHEIGKSIVWTPFLPPESGAEVAPQSRKQVVLGPLFFIEYLHCSKSIFGRFAFLSQTLVAIEIRSGKAIFLSTVFVNFSAFSSRKGVRTSYFVQRKSAESLQDHPRQEGNRTKREPWATALTGKKSMSFWSRFWCLLGFSRPPFWTLLDAQIAPGSVQEAPR